MEANPSISPHHALYGYQGEDMLVGISSLVYGVFGVLEVFVS